MLGVPVDVPSMGFDGIESELRVVIFVHFNKTRTGRDEISRRSFRTQLLLKNKTFPFSDYQE